MNFKILFQQKKMKKLNCIHLNNSSNINDIFLTTPVHEEIWISVPMCLHGKNSRSFGDITADTPDLKVWLTVVQFVMQAIMTAARVMGSPLQDGRQSVNFQLGVPKFQVWIEMLVCNPTVERSEAIGYRFRICVRDPKFFIGQAWHHCINQNILKVYSLLKKKPSFITIHRKEEGEGEELKTFKVPDPHGVAVA